MSETTSPAVDVRALLGLYTSARRLPVWLGQTVNAWGQVLLPRGGATRGEGATFLWRHLESGAQLELAGLWVEAEKRWWCGYEPELLGGWAWRFQTTDPQQQSAWAFFDVDPTPGQEAVPNSAIWATANGQPIVLTSGGMLTGLRIGELPPAEDLGALTLPGAEGADGAPRRVPVSQLRNDARQVADAVVQERVSRAGDSMAGPLSVVAPTDAGHAARRLDVEAATTFRRDLDAAPRSVLEKVDEIISPDDYRAIAIDDVAAVQMAITAALSQGRREVQMISRDYVWKVRPDGSSPYVEVPSNFSVKGNGSRALKAPAFDGPCFKSIVGENIVIDSIKFDGQFTTTNKFAGLTHEIWFEGGRNCTVRNCHWQRAKGLFTRGSRQFAVDGCTFYDVGVGVSVGGVTGQNNAMTYDLTISNCRFEKVASESIEPNDNIQGMLLINNTIIGGAPTWAATGGDEFVDIGGGDISGLIILGLTIVGNETQPQGLRIKAGAKRVCVSGLRIIGLKRGLGYGTGILIESGSTDISISDAWVDGARTLVAVSSGARNVHLREVRGTNFDASATAVRVASCFNVTLEDVYATGSSGDTVGTFQFINTVGLRLLGLNADGTGARAYDFDGCSLVRCADLRVSGANYGAYLLNCTDVEVEGLDCRDLILGSGGAAIVVNGGSLVTLRRTRVNGAQRGIVAAGVVTQLEIDGFYARGVAADTLSLAPSSGSALVKAKNIDIDGNNSNSNGVNCERIVSLTLADIEATRFGQNAIRVTSTCTGVKGTRLAGTESLRGINCGASGARLRDITARKNKRDGVILPAGTPNVSISGLDSQDNGTDQAAGTWAGLRVETGCDRLRLLDFDVSNPAGGTQNYGLQFAGPCDRVIYGIGHALGNANANLQGLGNLTNSPAPFGVISA